MRPFLSRLRRDLPRFSQDRDLQFWLRDETETFRDPDRDVFKMSQTLQPAKLLVSNSYKLCYVSSIYYAKHSSVSATVLQKLVCHFPKDCQHSCTMYWLSNHNLQ